MPRHSPLLFFQILDAPIDCRIGAAIAHRIANAVMGYVSNVAAEDVAAP
jgi:hypothetical protein